MHMLHAVTICTPRHLVVFLVGCPRRYGIESLLGANGVVVGVDPSQALEDNQPSPPKAYINDDLAHSLGHPSHRPHPQRRRRKPAPHLNSGSRAMLKHAYGDDSPPRTFDTHLTSPHDDARRVATLLAEWDPEQPPTPRDIAHGDYRSPAAKNRFMGRTGQARPVRRAGKPGKTQVSAFGRDTDDVQQASRSTKAAAVAQQALAEGRASPPGLRSKPLSPASGAVAAEGVRRPHPPTAVSPVLLNSQGRIPSPLRVRQLSSRGEVLRSPLEGRAVSRLSRGAAVQSPIVGRRSKMASRVSWHPDQVGGYASDEDIVSDGEDW